MKTNDSTKAASFRASLRKKLEAEETKEKIADPTTFVPVKPDIKNMTMETDESFDIDNELVEKGGPEEIGADLGEKSSKKESRKKNPDMDDFTETGRWGAVSKLEVLIVTIMVIFIAVGVTVALVLVLGGDDDGDANVPVQPAASKLLKPTEQMELIRKALDDNNVTESVWEDYRSNNPYRMAATWIVEDDDFDSEADILDRYALATVYYAFEGNEWTNSTNWLTSTPICEGWFGVTCDDEGNVVELELSNNNLQGEIPLVLVHLEHLMSLW